VVEHGRMVWRPKPKIAALGFVETDLGAEDNWRTLMRDQELYRAAAESRKRVAGMIPISPRNRLTHDQPRRFPQ
jgi:hypothetical protein